MSAPLQIRSSGMPLGFKCAASVRQPALPLREQVQAAELGTATHVILRRLAERGAIDWDSIPEVANQYGVDFAELRMLVAQASKLWHQVKDSFPNALTEPDISIELEGAVLTGHVDLISISGDVARVGDWKSGRLDLDYSEQMRAYGTLVLLRYPQLREVTVTILWLRDGEVENYTMTRADALVWAARCEEVVVRWDGTYRPGGHCAHCPRSHECDAANALLRRDVAVIADRSIVARAECELGLAALALRSDVEDCEAKAPLVVIVDAEAATLPPPANEDARVTLPDLGSAAE